MLGKNCILHVLQFCDAKTFVSAVLTCRWLAYKEGLWKIIPSPDKCFFSVLTDNPLPAIIRPALTRMTHLVFDEDQHPKRSPTKTFWKHHGAYLGGVTRMDMIKSYTTAEELWEECFSKGYCPQTMIFLDNVTHIKQARRVHYENIIVSMKNVFDFSLFPLVDDWDFLHAALIKRSQQVDAVPLRTLRLVAVKKTVRPQLDLLLQSGALDYCTYLVYDLFGRYHSYSLTARILGLIATRASQLRYLFIEAKNLRGNNETIESLRDLIAVFKATNSRGVMTGPCKIVYEATDHDVEEAVALAKEKRPICTIRVEYQNRF